MAQATWPRLVFLALLGAGLVGGAVDFWILLQPGRPPPEFCIQDDFRSYYFGAQALARGISPYDVEAIRAAFSVKAHFVYPWFMTAPFRLLLPMGFEHAQLAFLILKLAASASLAWLGWRLWAQDQPWPAWLIFFAVGLNGTWVRDLCLGNVVVFESLLLWMALALLLRGRILWFCLLVALASVNKLAYVGFVALAPLVYPHMRAAWLGALATLAAICGALTLGWLLEPQLMGEWYRSVRPILGFRYSWFNLGKHIFELQGVGDAQPPYWRRGETYLYVAMAGLVWIGGAWAYFRARQIRQPLPPLHVVSLFALAFAASVPFAFSYSWIYALGATLIAIAVGLARGGLWPFLALTVAALGLLPRALWTLLGIELPYNFVHLFTATAACLLLTGLSLARRRVA